MMRGMHGRTGVRVHAPVLASALVMVAALAPGARAAAPADAPPSIRFTGVFNGATLEPGRPAVLNAVGSDDVGIVQVRFLRDFTPFAVDTAAPYQAIYTPATPDRAELLTVEATDTAGQVSEFSIAVRIPPEPQVPEDRPPTIVLDSPAERQLIPTAGVRVSARAADDRGVGFVRFLRGARMICDDRTPPYACLYRPEAAEVGRVTTFTAVAVDTLGQTQGAIRDNRVARYRPLAVTLLAGNGRRAPGGGFRISVRGRVKLPDAITTPRGCTGGKVRVRARRGARTVGIAAPILDSFCRYRATLLVRGRGRVRLSASFRGNALVGAGDAPTLMRRAG